MGRSHKEEIILITHVQVEHKWTDALVLYSFQLVLPQHLTDHNGTGNSTNPPASGLLLTIDFANGMDNQLVQDTTDDRDWTFAQGETPSSGTGPKTGHGGADDGYLYFEASVPANTGDVAR